MSLLNWLAMDPDSPTADDARTSGTAGQFSIWAILRTTLFVAGWFALFRTWPHIAVFLMGVWMAFWSTRMLYRLRGKGDSLVKRGLICSLVMFCWAMLYVVSLGGPVAEISRRIGLVEGSHQILELGYAPLIWLYDATPLKRPLEIYLEHWTGGVH